MTDLPVGDPITEQIHAVDWSLEVPGDAPQSMVDALRARRSRRRKITLGMVTSVAVVGVLALVLGLPSLTRDSAPPVSDYSHIPAITLARLHSAGYDIAPPRQSARINGQEALRRACRTKSWAECGKPSAYLVDMKDNYRGGTQPSYRTYWLIAWPPRWMSMISCGPPSQVSHPLGCYTYAVAFTWIDAETGDFGGYDQLGVKNPPPLQLPHGQSP